ncbi:MAG: hypothetical protein U0T33_00715 [Bacteroidales bacterium]
MPKSLILDKHKLPMKEQRERLERSFIEWRGQGDQTDDIMIM